VLISLVVSLFLACARLITVVRPAAGGGNQAIFHFKRRLLFYFFPIPSSSTVVSSLIFVPSRLLRPAMVELKNEAFSSEAPIKSEHSRDEIGTAEEGGLSGPDHVELHRALKARHITMIAIGGAIGTGLIIGTGEALAKAGPGSILIAYAWVGFIVYLVMCALGEMAAWLPLPSGFTGYAVRFCDPALGFAMGWT